MQPSITCARDTGLTQDEVRNSRLYSVYAANLGTWRLLAFHVAWAFVRTNKETADKDIVMMFAEIEVRDSDNRIIKSGALLRGKTVEILPILIGPDDNRHTVFVSQSRVPVGCKVKSTPAGMVDGNSGEATVFNELQEELGRPVVWSEPVWLNKLVTGSRKSLYVSPGGSSEVVQYCYVTTQVTYDELAAFNGNHAGNAEEDEYTETSIAPMNELPEALSQYGVADSKTLTLILMYNHVHYMRGALE